MVDQKQIIDKDLNERPICIVRDRDRIACRVCGVDFYPVIGKLLEFTRYVCFNDQNRESDAKRDNPDTTLPHLLRAMPLDNQSHLVTAEIVTSSKPAGIGWRKSLEMRSLFFSMMTHPSPKTLDSYCLSVNV
jgi:hypothetical protein